MVFIKAVNMDQNLSWINLSHGNESRSRETNEAAGDSVVFGDPVCPGDKVPASRHSDAVVI